MKITAFDDLYSVRLSTGDTIIGGSSGSNAGYVGGDVLGGPGSLSVVGFRNTVSLSSNMGDNTVGTVLYASQGLYFTSLFYAVLIVMAVIGWRQWSARAANHTEAVAPVHA